MSLRASSLPRLVPCPRTSRKHSEPRKKTFLVLSPSQPRPGYLSASAIASLQLMTRASVAAYSRRRQRFLPSYIGTYISTVLRNASHLRDCHDPLQKTRCSPTPELQATLLPNILGPLNSRGRAGCLLSRAELRNLSRFDLPQRHWVRLWRRKIPVGRNISG
jgi:hypothetical protein